MLQRFVIHLEQEVAAAHKVEVEQLEVLAVRAGVHALEEVENLVVRLVAKGFNVVVHLNLLEHHFVLVERFQGVLAESNTVLVTKFDRLLLVDILC